MLTCTVELSTLVNYQMTVKTVWTGPDGLDFMNNSSVQPAVAREAINYTSTVMIASFGRSQSGIYTCTANVSDVNDVETQILVLSERKRITVGKKFN